MRVYTGGVADERKTAAGGITAAEMPTTTTTSKVEEAGRLPSIEMEPKTLTLDQIKYAREAALYVVSTKSEEEAIRIFTAGLKPVQMNTNGRKSGNSMDSSDDDVDLGGGGCYLDHHGSNTCGRGKGGCGRRHGGRRPSMDDIRDVATAPF